MQESGKDRAISANSFRPQNVVFSLITKANEKRQYSVDSGLRQQETTGRDDGKRRKY